MTITHPMTAADVEQIHRLNYQTFVEEIPQHEQNESGMLIDKFHEQNTYLLAKKEGRLIGMLCYRLNRPFSLDSKLENFDRFLPPHKKLAEIRLFSVVPEERRHGVGQQLMKSLCAELTALRVDAAVISGTTRQAKLYNSVGFTPFGPLVGTEEAAFQPMFIHINDLRDDIKNH